jgi:hypothetical protein
MKTAKNNRKSAQEIQDKIFRKMSVEKKLEMLDGFFRFAKELNSIGKKYGTNRTSQKSCKNTGTA